MLSAVVEQTHRSPPHSRAALSQVPIVRLEITQDAKSGGRDLRTAFFRPGMSTHLWGGAGEEPPCSKHLLCSLGLLQAPVAGPGGLGTLHPTDTSVHQREAIWHGWVQPAGRGSGGGCPRGSHPGSAPTVNCKHSC